MKCDFSGKTILDIGRKFRRLLLLHFKAAGRSGRLFAFEAQPELCIHLDAVKETYHLDNLTVVKQALSSTPGVLK